MKSSLSGSPKKPSSRPRRAELLREISDNANEARREAEWWFGAADSLDADAKREELAKCIERMGRYLDDATVKLRWLKRDVTGE